MQKKIATKATKSNYRALHLEKWNQKLEEQKKQNEEKAKYLKEKDLDIKQQQNDIKLKYAHLHFF